MKDELLSNMLTLKKRSGCLLKDGRNVLGVAIVGDVGICWFISIAAIAFG